MKLLGENKVIKLCDLGLGKFLRNDTKSSSSQRKIKEIRIQSLKNWCSKGHHQKHAKTTHRMEETILNHICDRRLVPRVRKNSYK